MKNIDLYHFAILLTPVCSILVALFMLGCDIWNVNIRHRQTEKWLFVFFMFMALHELYPIFYFYIPDVFVHLDWLFLGVTLSAPVFCYRFVFDITCTRANEHFPWIHYIIPIVAIFLSFSLMAVAPGNGQHSIATSHEKYFGENFFSTIIMSSKFLIKILIGSFYLIACFIRIDHFRKWIIHHVSETPMRWERRSLLFIALLIATSIFAILIPDTLYRSPVTTILLPILAFLQVTVVYCTLQGKFSMPELVTEIPDRPKNESKAESQEQLPLLKKNLLTKAYFEEYMHTQKPFLNPDMKITDLTTGLQVNRTYISNFINREYHMNFSRYINRCRLDEYHRLLTDPAMKDKSDEEISEFAGFSSYRYFLRLNNEK